MRNTKPLWLSLILLGLIAFPAIGLGGHASILVDAHTGKIVLETDANRAWYPASLTKVMTLYMAFNALKHKQIHLHDTITVSSHAARQPTSKLGLRTGEHISVQEAILALITRSANDAAVALAEHIGGNEENFAAKMTAQAHGLGMYDSHFMNASGLPHPWQVTTARDLALLAWRVMRDFPEFYGYFGARGFYFRGTELRAINKFTNNYPGAEGMKTGFTCGSGYNLMSTASRNGGRLIGVVLGGRTSPHRYQLMTELMDAGFAGQYPTPTKMITTVPQKFTAAPPYLLACGKGAIGSDLSGPGQSGNIKTAAPTHKSTKKAALAKSPAKSRHAKIRKKTVKKSSRTRYHH